MAPVIWGLNLGEIQWGKFKSSYMWNNKYHLRRTKFIMYQLSMILCVVSESLGTASLSNYVDAQEKVWNENHRAVVHNNDYVGVASFNIFAGVFNAFIFGAAFFFDLFWPERYESKNVRIAWKACAVLSTVIICASAFALTIITSTRHAFVTGVPYDEGVELNSHYTKEGGAPLTYKNNGRALAAVIMIWPGFVCTLASCVIMFYSIDHWEELGPLSTHERKAADAQDDNVDVETGEKSQAAQQGAATDLTGEANEQGVRSTLATHNAEYHDGVHNATGQTAQ